MKEFLAADGAGNPFRAQFGKPVVLRGRLELADVRRLQSLLMPWRRRLAFYGLMVFTMLVFVFLLRIRFPWGLLVVVGFVSLILSVQMIGRRRTQRAWAEGRGFFAPQQIEISDEGVRVASLDVQTNYAWSAFSGFRGDAELALLFHDPATSYTPLVRSWCEHDADWVRLVGYLQAALPPR